jgi:hypothetical protein
MALALVFTVYHHFVADTTTKRLPLPQLFLSTPFISQVAFLTSLVPLPNASSPERRRGTATVVPLFAASHHIYFPRLFMLYCCTYDPVLHIHLLPSPFLQGQAYDAEGHQRQAQRQECSTRCAVRTPLKPKGRLQGQGRSSCCLKFHKGLRRQLPA